MGLIYEYKGCLSTIKGAALLTYTFEVRPGYIGYEATTVAAVSFIPCIADAKE